MEQHGFHKQKLTGPNDLKDGDIVMIKAPSDGRIHLSPIIHVAIVMHDKDGKLILIQKPDDIHHVQKSSWKDFRDHFRKAVPNLDIPGPDVDVYRR